MSNKQAGKDALLVTKCTTIRVTEGEDGKRGVEKRGISAWQ